jgi:hypothetical protein
VGWLVKWLAGSVAVVTWAAHATPASPAVSHSETVVLEVGPQRQPCMGMVPRMCLMVREVPPGTSPGPWQPWFEEIAGFAHVAGQPYRLRVRQDRLARPPADAADTRYTLIEVLQPRPGRPAGGSS